MKKDLSHSIHDQERDYLADQEDLGIRRREERTWKAYWCKLHQQDSINTQEDSTHA